MNKRFPHRPISSLLPLLLIAPGFVIPDVAIAQSGFRPPRSGAPGNREAGASRSDTCAATADRSGLLALLPTSNLGLTTKAFPTFFAYIPPNNAQRAEFRLLEEGSQKEVFTGQVMLPQADSPNPNYRHKASIVELTLPQSGIASGLTAGKKYVWALMMVCNPNNRAEDIVVIGGIERIGDEYVKSLDPQTQLKLKSVSQAPGPERLSVYGAAGIWQDLLADVATLMRKNPSSYSDDWKSLLGEQGLGAIATAPIVVSQLEPIQP
ncbi:MAG: DUF928 domain-containing protein [Leptolyngbyaceae cyanobacterium bins.349]|nr:DUF928 domain-containing protein [Leptolyngbyaceae cyanobacterium bins.349]